VDFSDGDDFFFNVFGWLEIDLSTAASLAVTNADSTGDIEIRKLVATYAGSATSSPVCRDDRSF